MHLEDWLLTLKPKHHSRHMIVCGASGVQGESAVVAADVRLPAISHGQAAANGRRESHTWCKHSSCQSRFSRSRSTSPLYDDIDVSMCFPNKLIGRREPQGRFYRKGLLHWRMDCIAVNNEKLWNCRFSSISAQSLNWSSVRATSICTDCPLNHLSEDLFQKMRYQNWDKLSFDEHLFT